MTSNMTTIKEQVASRIKSMAAAAKALAETIEEMGEVPSGHLYASVMSVLDLRVYEHCISLLIDLGWIRKRGDLLMWVGRADESANGSEKERVAA